MIIIMECDLMKKLFMFLLLIIIFSSGIIVNAVSDIVVNDDKTVNYNGKIYSYSVDYHEDYVLITLDYKTCKYYSKIDNQLNTFSVLGEACNMNDYYEVFEKIQKYEGVSIEKIREKEQKRQTKKEITSFIIIVILMSIGITLKIVIPNTK